MFSSVYSDRAQRRRHKLPVETFAPSQPPISLTPRNDVFLSHSHP